MANFLSIAVLIFVLSLAQPGTVSGQACHGGGAGSGGGGAPVSGPGIPAAALCQEEDTSSVSVSIYGSLSGSLSPDGHRGDPLGTGGKIPVTYNSSLYKESTPEKPALAKPDLRVQYLDFGYIPIWRSSVLYAQTRLKIRDNLHARLGLSYGGEPGSPGTNTTTGLFGIGEASLVWLPKRTPGISLQAGNILDVGGYSPIFDQAPLNNFSYTGILASYTRETGENSALDATIAFGNTPQNFVSRLESKSGPVGASAYYLQTIRQRSYLYAKTGVRIKNMASLRAIGGYQLVPNDTSIATNPRAAFPKTEGWHAGLEASIGTIRQNHTFAVSWGLGDVVLGWGTPDFVRYRAVDTVYNSGADTIYVDRYAKKNSSLTNLIYWGNSRLGRLTLSAGSWVMLRDPDQITFQEVNPHYGPGYSYLNGDSLFSAAGAPRGDSIVEIAPQPFNAVKLVLFPSVELAQILHAGVRVDHIRYLNPKAHTNLMEPVRDPALRYAQYPGIYEFYAPALWDAEAVNTTIISPILSIDFDGVAGITASYSYGLYDSPVSRQGAVANRHSNAAISTYFNYRIRS